jgi:hypothetical protein
MTIDIEKFYKILCDNINNVDHIVNNYIIENNITHTKNNNGIFFNLRILNDKQIDELHNLVINFTDNMYIYNKEIKVVTDIINNTKINKKKIKAKEYHELDIQFTKEQINLINLSKYY